MRRFIKMQGCGNDYVFFDCLDEERPCKIEVPAVCDRHRGVGGDGVVLIESCSNADGSMRMFNLDGSEGLMCGNAIRCVAKYLWERRKIGKPVLSIATKSGVKRLLRQKDGSVVDMGAPSGIREFLDGVSLSIGNPHVVFFDKVFDEAFAKDLQSCERFPSGVNVSFARPCGNNRFSVRVWERGSGETLSCGSGACAVAVAGGYLGLANRNKTITLLYRGGMLRVRLVKERVFLLGDAHICFEGNME